MRDSIAIAQHLRSRDISLWFADGSNYPGTANITQRRRWFEEGLKATHVELGPDQRLLIEYKPFEPAFYHTDIADWGMALLLARVAGLRQPRVAARRVSAFCAAGRSSVPQSNWLCVNASPQYASQSAVIRP